MSDNVRKDEGEQFGIQESMWDRPPALNAESCPCLDSRALLSARCDEAVIQPGYQLCTPFLRYGCSTEHSPLLLCLLCRHTSYLLTRITLPQSNAYHTASSIMDTPKKERKASDSFDNDALNSNQSPSKKAKVATSPQASPSKKNGPTGSAQAWTQQEDAAMMQAIHKLIEYVICSSSQRIMYAG